MTPNSALDFSGLCAAPLWSSKCAYLTTTGIRYSEISKKTSDDMITRYFGVFFFIFQSGQIWGNLISSLVLQQGTGDYTFREKASEICGVNFCPQATSGESNSNGSCGSVNGSSSDTPCAPEKRFVYMMLSIYLGCGVLAILLIIVFLDRWDKQRNKHK